MASRKELVQSWLFVISFVVVAQGWSVDAAFLPCNFIRCAHRETTPSNVQRAATRDPEKDALIGGSCKEELNQLLVEKNDNSPYWSQSLYVSILLSAACFLPFVAAAVDHPVDHFHLGIPTPVPDVRYFISGGLCAAVSHGVTTPVDVIKTRIQAEPEVFSEGLIESTKLIIEKDGLKALLGGLGPTVVGYGAEGAMKFGLYESLKPVFVDLLSSDNPAIPYLGASVVAGAVASLMLCPMERTRIRLVTDPSFASGLFTGLPKIVEEEGIQNLFSGMPAMLSKQVPYTITKQVSFDEIAQMLYDAAAKLHWAAKDIKYEVSLAAAFLASILSCITSHPGDVVLTDTYKKSENASFGKVVSEVFESQGFRGFFAGLSARFFHVGAIITSQLVLYDAVKQLLGLPATGSH